MSFPALFFAFSSVALIAGLVAIWNSLRAALGGGDAVALTSARDLPDHAALVEEKNSLLRAIKDLEYERAVGKISDADHQRLDAAYRARAKQVLQQLDRDVKPLYEEAERLIAERIGRSATAAKKDAPEPEATSEAPAPARAPERGFEEIIDDIASGRIAAMPELPESLTDEQRAKIARVLQQMLDKVAKKESAPPASDDAASTTTERPE